MLDCNGRVVLQVVSNAALIAIRWARPAALAVLLQGVQAVLPAAGPPHEGGMLHNVLQNLALHAAGKVNVAVNAAIHNAIRATGVNSLHPSRLLSIACSSTKQLEFEQLEQLWRAWCPTAGPDALLEALCAEV